MSDITLEYTSIYMMWKDPFQSVYFSPFIDGWEKKLEVLREKLTPDRFAEFQQAVLDARKKEGFSE